MRKLTKEEAIKLLLESASVKEVEILLVEKDDASGNTDKDDLLVIINECDALRKYAKYIKLLK